MASRAHSQQHTRATTSMNADHAAGGARKTIARRTTSATTAVITRVASMAVLAGLFRGFALGELLARAPEAALAAAVGGDRLVERGGPEIGPQRLGEVELRVRELPEKEVRHARLAPGADEEVGLGGVAHGEEA